MNKYFIIIYSILITIAFPIQSQTNYFEISKGLEIFNGVFKELNMYYVDDTKPGDLIEEAIESMLETLDPYTTFIPESKIEDFRFQTTGQYGGIGSLISKSENYIYITEPYKDFPADKAGLKIGDIILKIDNVSIKDKSVEDVSTLLKGEPGTKVQLNIKRLILNSEKEIEEINMPIDITREKITISSVPYYGILKLSDFLENESKDYNCAYIKLNRFTRGCSEEVRKSLLDLESKEEIDNIILDLRGNPGGLLNESVDLCNLFIPQNEIVVSTKGRNTDWDKIYKTKKKPYNIETPLIVLVDQYSASASEIVAGTIQDLDRGVVIGFKTFGKGLVQQTRKLDYNCQLKVTVAKYYTPSGRCIQKINYSDNDNIIPDSLRTEFKTRNGRSVFDGGGIEPDIKMDEDTMPPIIYDLLSKRMFFKFGNNYYPTIKEIESPEEFDISEDIFDDFVEFLNKNKFEFETESEKQLKVLYETISTEDYTSELEDQFSIFETRLSEVKKEDVFKFQDKLSMLILDDLIVRSHYKKGRIKALLKFDDALIESLKLFSDNKRYNSILELN